MRGEKGKNRRCRNKTSDPSGICNVHRPAPEPAPPAPPADPPPIYDPDDDLYGLSPTGEQSLAKIRAVKESQQEPATAQPSLSQSPSPYRQRDEEPDLPEHPTVSPLHGVPPPKPNIDSDIMASPRSSSSFTLSPEPPTPPRTSTQQRHNRKPRRSTRQPRRTPQAKTRNLGAGRSNGISTAELVALLPRPRRRVASTRIGGTFDVPSSDARRDSERDAEMWDVLADSEREEEEHARRRVRRQRSGDAVAAPTRKQGVEGSSAPPADPTQATEPAPAAPATPAADPAESAAPPTVRTPYLSL